MGKWEVFSFPMMKSRREVIYGTMPMKPVISSDINKLLHGK